MILRLELYTDEQLATIVKRSAGILNIPIEQDGALQIASRSRGTPRIANRLLKRSRDFAQVKYDGVINAEAAEDALSRMEIDQLGLDGIDRRLLTTMIKNYNGGPVGLETIAAAIGEEAVTIEGAVFNADRLSQPHPPWALRDPGGLPAFGIPAGRAANFTLTIVN